MTRIRVLTLLMTMVLAVAGCSDDGPAPPAEPLSILPLESGSRWIYRETELDQSGAARKVYLDTFAMLGDTVIDGEVWRKSSGNLTSSNAWRNSPDGLYFYSSKDEGYRVLFMKYPVSANERFRSSTGLMELSALNVPVEVPHGEYTCLEYRYFDSSGRNHYWSMYVAPRFGIVRIDTYHTSAGGRYLSRRYELIAATVTKRE